MNEENVKTVDDVEVEFNCAIETLGHARKKYLMGEYDLAYAALAMAEEFVSDTLNDVYPEKELLQKDKTKRAIEWEALRVLKPYLKKRP